MAGKRAWTSSVNGTNQTAKKGATTSTTTATRPRHGNRASQLSYRRPGPKPRLFSFKDAPASADEEQEREELKSMLLHAVDESNVEKYRKSDEELKQIRDKKVRQFYEAQNDKLDDWLEANAIVTALADDILESFNPDRDLDGIPERQGALQTIGEDVEAFLPEEFQKRRQKDERRARWAININVVANIVLLVAKIAAVFFSSSLSLMASTIDSGLDLLCTLIIWTTNKLVQWKLQSLKSRFPVGRRRLEPLGILVFSIIMVISFLQILQESFVKLLPSGDHTLAVLPPIAIGAMAATISIKGLIWLVCMPIKTSQVQALSQDCKTDVFFNTLSLTFPFIGLQLHRWQLDPLGAFLLSLFVIFDWSSTCLENVVRLSGSTACDRTVQKLLFVVFRFEKLVTGFKKVTAYHAGDGIWVEVDLLMDPRQSVMRSHDVAETLQYCLEGLGEVDRAFVTVDYTSLGPTGHSSTLLA